LERATFAAYRRALKPGGWLLFETFIRTGETDSDADFELVYSEETTGIKPAARPTFATMPLPMTRPAQISPMAVAAFAIPGEPAFKRS
jgi:hypothetical protein